MVSRVDVYSINALGVWGRHLALARLLSASAGPTHRDCPISPVPRMGVHQLPLSPGHSAGSVLTGARAEVLGKTRSPRAEVSAQGTGQTLG